MCKKILCVLLGVVMIAGTAYSETPKMKKDQVGSMMKEGANMASDQMAQQCQQNFARCLLLGCQEQVLLGEFAAERVQTPEVWQFVQSLVKEHNEHIAKLERFAPGALSTDALGKQVEIVRAEWKSDKGTMPVSSETGESARKMEVDSSKMTPEKSMAHMMQMMTTISQQMAENCIALTESELSQVDKDQFDRAFIGQQICSHIATLAKLKTLEPYAPVELKSYIESAEKVTRAHLDQAKNICKQWDSKSSASTNRGSY